MYEKCLEHSRISIICRQPPALWYWAIHITSTSVSSPFTRRTGDRWDLVPRFSDPCRAPKDLAPTIYSVYLTHFSFTSSIWVFLTVLLLKTARSMTKGLQNAGIIVRVSLFDNNSMPLTKLIILSYPNVYICVKP